MSAKKIRIKTLKKLATFELAGLSESGPHYQIKIKEKITRNGKTDI